MHSIAYQVRVSFSVRSYQGRKTDRKYLGYFTKCECGWWVMTKKAREGRQAHALHIVGKIE
jgi:hypothetical protein